MMLTRQGVLKISDFGLCKNITKRNDKFHDTLGTYTHLAAETLRHEPYGIEVDWWALGVSLYQLRTKTLPFYGSREVEMERNTCVREWFTFSDLLVSLMAIHPEARLGYHSIDDVKRHTLFMEVDFEAILTGAVLPPYVSLMKPGVNFEYFLRNDTAAADSSSASSYSSSSSSFSRRDLTI